MEFLGHLSFLSLLNVHTYAMQSLANEIKTFSKTALKKQCTQVTTLGGKRLIETWQGSNLCVVEDGGQPDGAYGYIEDNSLDLQVGVIKPYLLLGELEECMNN